MKEVMNNEKSMNKGENERKRVMARVVGKGKGGSGL